jgi:FMN phosphatase YigB (HAD superfamily)
VNAALTPAARIGPRRVRVRADELARAFDELAPGLRVLSLDCFDTLLWRQTATPVDVFYDLQESAAFKRLNYNAKLRVTSEGAARQLKILRTGRSEVTLPEIYRAAFPDLTDAEVAELAEAELAAEMAACHPFPPVVDLIRAARRRGLKVVIVSDTYLDEPMLRRLLAATLPEDAARAIDRVFCSSAHGYSKVQGLHARALDRLKVPPRAVLHVGDHEAADFEAAGRAGLHAFHLAHHEPWVAENLRLQGTTASLLTPSVRQCESLPSPFRAMLGARAQAGAPSPADALGYAGAGPILYAFARFVLDEIASLRAEGRRVKPLFLLRDGHLPRLVTEAVAGGPVGHAAAVSRFAAYAASFRTEADVERYLAKSAGSGRFEDLCRQLLLPVEEAAAISAKARQARQPLEEFLRLVRRPETLRTIVERSGDYRARFYRYLESTCGLERGDTLLFIDLGYEGTAQRQLEDVLRDERDVTVRGCYLLAARVPGGERTRRGLLDPSWCDDRALGALVAYIALLEDLCTSDDGSVVAYAEDGAPVHGPHLIAAAQYERVKPVQARCVDFARDAEAFFASVGRRPSPASLRLAALGALGRLLFFPSEPEVAYLDGFQLDMGLATDDTYALFDCEEGLDGLRRRGLFFMEQGRRGLRMNYPIELRAAGLELSLALLSQHRYALEFARADMTLRREPLKVLVARGAGTALHTADAQATHDGFFSLIVPVGARDMHLGVMFGQRYAWVQIESVHLVRHDALFGSRESEHTEDVGHAVRLEGMVERGPGVFECPTEAGFLFVSAPPAPGDQEPYVCRIVFRPLSLRQTPASAP